MIGCDWNYRFRLGRVVFRRRVQQCSWAEATVQRYCLGPRGVATRDRATPRVLLPSGAVLSNGRGPKPHFGISQFDMPDPDWTCALPDSLVQRTTALISSETPPPKAGRGGGNLPGGTRTPKHVKTALLPSVPVDQQRRQPVQCLQSPQQRGI